MDTGDGSAAAMKPSYGLTQSGQEGACNEGVLDAQDRNRRRPAP
jgi:hypothetical protein